MRKRIWITGIVVLAICLLLLLVKAPRNQKPVLPEEGEIVTNQQSPASPATRPRAAEPAKKASAPASAPDVAAEMARSRTPEGTNEMQERALARWQAPISFYGKVVDESSNAVAGADITFGWSEFPTEAGARRATTKSDAIGFFSLQDKRGPALDIWVNKEGYYASHGGQKGFSYMNGDFSPDPQNPVVFSLRKKGTPAEGLLGVKRNDRIPRDGTPVSFNLATGATSTGETGNLVVRCWTEDQGKRSGEKYDWRCVLAVPGGGVVRTNEEFAFLAPESGYEPSFEINMPADRPDWNSQVDLKFYYRLTDGRYGRMTFSMIAGGQHFCMIDSVLNPTGSRNLEPAASSQ